MDPASTLSLPFDVTNKKVRAAALKKRIEQIFPSADISNVKYKSDWGVYHHPDDESVEFPFFFEIVIIGSKYFQHNLAIKQALNWSVAPNNRIVFGGEQFWWTTQNSNYQYSSNDIRDIFLNFGYSENQKKCKKPNSLIICNLISPRIGIALLNTRGFLVEYAEILAKKAPEEGCNIFILTDLDASGLCLAAIVLSFAHRIGIDFETLDELELDIEDVQEPYDPKRHFGPLKYGGEHYGKYSSRIVNYISKSRVEINSVMVALDDNEKFWDWIENKMRELADIRDYNRSVGIPEYVTPEALDILNKIMEIKGKVTLQKPRERVVKRLSNFEDGFLFDRTDRVLRGAKKMTITRYESILSDHARHMVEQAKNNKPLMGKIWAIAKEEYEQLKEVLSDSYLQYVEGISPTIARKFSEVGIVSVIDLVFADVEDLAVELNWSSENASKYIKAAQKLLREKLAEQGIKRTTADSIADNYQKYITSSDPVRAFYENRLYLDAGVTIPKDQLYQAYQDFCKENSLSPESEQSFSRTLTKEPYKLEYKWLKAADNGGEKKYHWIGVGIRGQQPTTDEYQSTIII
jgi:hypothetical protein